MALIEQVSPVAAFVALATMWFVALGASVRVILNDPSAIVRTVAFDTMATPLRLS